jgi:2-polyprenyl-6-methoxyphenol hydroxylase-like FAD-dependent oxidoreductase
MPPTACTRSRARASISASATPRRSLILGSRGPVTDAGAAILLERYARRRAGPVLAMQLVTDGLVRLFDVRASWLRVLRNRGMRAVGAVGVLKRLLAQPALR